MLVSLWFLIRKPLVEPTAFQRQCWDVYQHSWRGCPLTSQMVCGVCHYRPYRAPEITAPARRRAYTPELWKREQ